MSSLMKYQFNPLQVYVLDLPISVKIKSWRDSLVGVYHITDITWEQTASNVIFMAIVWKT